MLKSWNIQKVPKYHGILVGSSMCFYSMKEPFMWTLFVAKSWMFKLVKKDMQPIYWYLTIYHKSLSMQSISLSNSEYRGGHAYLVVLVQVGTFDWHQILNVHYSRTYRYAMFDSVHIFLQRYGTAEAVFVSPTLKPPGVLPSCECFRYTIVHH